MRTTACGPGVNLEPGKTYLVEKKFAEALIAGKYAIAGDPRNVAAPPETADEDDGEKRTAKK